MASRWVSRQCCQPALDPGKASRHRPAPRLNPRIRLMPRRFASLLTLALLGALLGLTAPQSPAKAASFLERNFWLSGPRYDGNLPDCTWALGTVSNQFAEKEKRFWNSALQI